MSAYSWLYGVSGDWSTVVDWSGGAPNSSTANVTIATPGTYTIDIASGESFSIGALTLSNASATLQIDGTLSLASTLTLSSGTIDLNGTLNLMSTLT